MIADFLTVSIPDERMGDIKSRLLELVFHAGAVSTTALAGKATLYRVSSGTIRIEERNGFHTVGLSGVALNVFREKNLFSSYLGLISEVPHRVTRLDIAHDVSVATAPLLNRLYRKVNSTTGIRLTRKKIRTHNLVLSKSSYSSDKTGTLYIGAKTAEARAKVYDKRHEIFCRSGVDIGSSLTRYELTVTNKVGICLSDAYSPDSCFWHFMQQVLSPPKGYVDEWFTTYLEFDMPGPPDRLPAQRLREKVESSGDLDGMVRLADEIGPRGLEYLMRLLRTRVGQTLPDEPKTSLQGALGVFLPRDC